MRSYRRYVGRRMIIQTADQAIDGTVSEVDRESVTVTEASLLSVNEPVRLDGDISVPDHAIRWVQVV